jgi:hypothetical protein
MQCKISLLLNKVAIFFSYNHLAVRELHSEKIIGVFYEIYWTQEYRLLDNTRLSVSGCLWCIARQASICRAAGLADAREFSSVMGTIDKFVVSRFEWSVSHDNKTEECWMGYKCFSNT